MGNCAHYIVSYNHAVVAVILLTITLLAIPLVTGNVVGRLADFWCRQSLADILCNIAVATMTTTQLSGGNIIQPTDL